MCDKDAGRSVSWVYAADDANVSQAPKRPGVLLKLNAESDQEGGSADRLVLVTINARMTPIAA